ncbi:MAG: glucoamylase [Verrucomicrobiales bacterium]|nr:glucoamylase [Verrucomicrobiales bacterium]
MSHRIAFGHPGIEPRWTSSAKVGIGTAYHTSSCLWFTLSHGIVNEIYFPHVDTPNSRDLQFLITDGETFCHEERCDLEHEIEYPEPGTLLYRITTSDPESRYRIIKEIIADPHSPVLLIQARLEILDPSLMGKLRLFALLAPHLNGTGANNSAHLCDLAGRQLIEAFRDGIDLSFGCSPDFKRRSVGYVGFSDGWQDLMDNFSLDWEFQEALEGNIAVIGEVDLSYEATFTVGVGFGRSSQSACAHLLQSFAVPFEQHRERFIAQWQRSPVSNDLEAHTGDGGGLARLSQSLLMAHEDKVFQGGFVASLSIPWGDTKDDSDQGGYHLVWTRDMVQTATALLACGHTESPMRALIWLASVQRPDGNLPQNSSIRGDAYWTGVQLDEVAAPILLAWRLRRDEALGDFDPWVLISRAARYLMLNGPVTPQERWEENSGYSPSTVATIIAGLVCAAEFAKEREESVTENLLLSYADWLSDHLEEWMVTECGELVSGKRRHFIRITPADPDTPEAAPAPDRSDIWIANGGGHHPARNVVGGDFLHLVRLGVRLPDDPVILDSIEVIDEVLKHDLPPGSCWRRYNHDGYGEKRDGSAYNGSGEGRCWPILTGERGHYELALGRDPIDYIRMMERFANAGGMLPEQLWDGEDLPDRKLKRGEPTGSAMPLCWSHAEYLSLVRSRKDGVCFDRIEPAFQRYSVEKRKGALEIWTVAHRLKRISAGKSLRILTNRAAKVHWSADDWVSIHPVDTEDGGIGCWFADLSINKLPDGSVVEFTFQHGDEWVGENYRVEVADKTSTGGGK